MNKRLLIIGPKGSGSRIIAQAIEQTDKPIRKVANLLYTRKTIIVPSQYLENPWMHKHIIALQQEAHQALFLLPIQSMKKSYPPNFAQVFRIPIAGVITYKNGDFSEEKVLQAQRSLKEIGIKRRHIQVDLTDKNDVLTVEKYLNMK